MNSNFEIFKYIESSISGDYQLSTKFSPEHFFFFFAKRCSGIKLKSNNYGYPKYDTGFFFFFFLKGSGGERVRLLIVSPVQSSNTW